MATAATNPISVAFGRTPSPWGLLALWPGTYRGLWGHPCHKACPYGLLQPLCAGRGFWGLSCHRPWPSGGARLVTALSTGGGCYSILPAGLGYLAMQGWLPPSTRRQGLLGAFLAHALAPWPCVACHRPLCAGKGFGGTLATGLGRLALQCSLQPSSCRQGLLAALLLQALALWSCKACYSPLSTGICFGGALATGLGGILATGLGPIALQGLSQPSSRRWVHLGSFLPQGLGPLASQGLSQPSSRSQRLFGGLPSHTLFLQAGQGLWGHSCHIPCPHGPARLATALSVQAGAFCHAPWPARLVTALSVQAGALGILVAGLCPLAPQGLLQPSMASQGLLQTSHSCHKA
jgi:hypothetical protein